MKRTMVCAAAAMLAIGGAGVSAMASGSSAPADAAPSTATAKVGSAALQGWQGDYTYAVPAGLGALFFHYPCSGALVADGGKYDVDFADPAANSVHVIAEGVRTDVAGKHEFMWKINWFGSGAPAGSKITFNVHCVRK